MKTLQIQYALSDKGFPYDNKKAEVTFKNIKIRFVYDYVLKLNIYQW